jgi:hypothetical protein
LGKVDRTCGDGTGDDILWNVRVSVREMEGLTVKMETVTLIGKGRKNLTCFVREVYEIKVKVTL